MDFAEIAFQNVAGFPATARISLAGGLNAFVSPETDLFLVLRALFGPLNEDITALKGVGVPRKLALTIHGDDGNNYRLVRDLDGGRLLLRADPVTKKPVKISETPEEIARVLLDVAGVPELQLLRHHLWLSQVDLPSRAVAKPAKSGNDLGGAYSSAEITSITAEEARQKLPGFQAELKRADEFEQTQDTLYEMQQRLAEMNRTSSGVLELEKQVHELTHKAEAYRKVNDIGPQVEARIKKYPEIVARRDAALAEVRKKRAEYEQSLAGAPQAPPLLKDQIFLGGMGAGILCLVVAAAVGHPAVLWALDIIPFGVAAFGAWRWVDIVEASDRDQRRLLDLNELEKRVQKQYDADMTPLQQAMTALGASSSDEVVTRIEERDLLDARRVAALRELENRRSDPKCLAQEQERLRVEQEVRKHETFVHTMGFTRESAAIRRDIATCEQALGSGGVVGDGEPLWAAVDAAARFAATEPRALLESLRERLNQYLMALTDRKYVGVRWAGPGLCHVVASAGGVGPLSGVPVAERDMIFIALRLALAERVAAPAKRPFFVDDPSVLVDAGHRGLFVKMLKTLGGMTQVVVRAFDTPPAGVVDHVAKVGAAA